MLGRDSYDFSSSNLDSDESDDNLEEQSCLLIYSQLLHQQAIEAAALAYSRIESDDDYLPDQVDGDFSVDPGRPVSDVLQKLLNAHNLIFNTQTGFTFDEWN